MMTSLKRSFESFSIRIIGTSLICCNLKTDHGEEHAKLWVHVHCISISEDKGFAAFLFAGENYCNLLGCN